MFKLTTKLAWSNLKLNRRLYYPFASVTIVMMAITYIFMSLANSPQLNLAKGGGDAKLILKYGLYVVSIAAFIIIVYANAFVIKNRSKELGLYDILGLEKKHIIKMLFYELLIFFFITVTLGLMVGLILNNVAFTLLLNLMDLKIKIDSSLQLPTVIKSIALFLGIYIIIWLINCLKIIRNSALGLIKDNRQGEAKGKLLKLQAIVGTVILLLGYYLSQKVTNPIEALPRFFLAVLLVIVATYILFNAGIITLLKFLQKRSNYYYKPQNFISISNLIFRMRKNAVGLATIAILSTMVLVTISGTANIYLGGKDSIRISNPNEFSVSLESNMNIGPTLRQLDEQMENFAKVNNLKTKNKRSVSYMTVGFSRSSPNRLDFETIQKRMVKTPDVGAQVISTEDYNRLTGDHLHLSNTQLALYSDKNSFKNNTNLTIGKQTFHISKIIKTSTLAYKIPDATSPVLKENLYLVVNDRKQLFSNVDMRHLYLTKTIYSGFDTNKSIEKQLSLKNSFSKFMSPYSNYGLKTSVQAYSLKTYMNTMGTLFFIGLLLSGIFLLGVVLVIYYKQISEAYEDQSRFIILDKVGLDENQVSSTIRKQIVTIFFIPLLFSLLHLAFSYHVLRIIIGMFGISNDSLVLHVTIGFSCIFVIVYMVVFALTTKAYKRIITRVAF
nr:ABC transporter permease [Streptococcus sobrinus]